MKKSIVNRSLILVMILAFVLTGCNVNGLVTQNAVQDEVSFNYGFSREQYNFNLPSLLDEQVVKVADSILEGKMIVEQSINDYLAFESLKDINWDAVIGNSPNTYQLYLQCLNPIMFLTRAYEINGNEDYLVQAKDILLEWIKYKESNPNNNFLWYDHGTALRLENIIYFVLVTTENTDLIDTTLRMKIDSLIKEHMEFLYDDVNYTENHNHGIFQDRALLYGAYFIKDEKFNEYVEKVKSRLDEQIEFGFNEEMIHIENSPGYQVGVVQIIYQIAEFLEQFNDVYGINLMNKVKQSNEFLTHILKPDAGMAEIGDTNGTVEEKQSNLGYKFNDEELLYAGTWGEKGTKPSEKSKLYPKSGYYIYRSSWEKEKFKEATWMMFKSGYESRTHKHADDTSFMLYSKGKDIFVDPGWYNYVTGDKYRDYLISAKAHNTVIVDGKSYSVTEPNAYKVGIIKGDLENPNYDYVLGFNKMYKGVQIDRHFYNLKEDAIILYDDIVSEQEHMYSQLFHTSEYIDILEADDNEVLMSIADTDYNVRIRQMTQDTKLEVHYGDNNGEEYGYLSRSLNKIEPIYTLEFKKQGNSTKYITLITIEDKGGKCIALDDINLDKDMKKLTIHKGGSSYNIQLTNRDRIDASKVEVQQLDNSTYKFISEQINTQDLYYAWYIIDAENGAVLDRIDYTQSNELTYTFNEEKDYLVKSYVKTSYGEIDQAIVSQINYIDNKYIDISDTIDNFKLTLGDHYYEQVADNKYRFIIPYDYFWKTSVKWYIYKDGGYYTTITGENILEYEFTEPGSYTVMFYFKTLNGDLEFWNYKPLEIR